MSQAKSFKCPKCGTARTQSVDERLCRVCGLDLLAAEKLNSVMVFSTPRKKNGPIAFMLAMTVIAVVMAGCSKLSVKTSPAPSSVPILPTVTHVPWTPTASATPIPTQPVVASVPSSTSQPCYRWDQVTKEMVGQTVCMYGVITDFIQARGAATRYRFSSKPNTFFLFSKDFEIFDPRTGKTIAPGTCVKVTATLRFNGAPYMDLDDLQGASTGPTTHEMNNMLFYDNASRCGTPPTDTSG